jgi:RND family efflux transporter MFP subunit
MRKLFTNYWKWAVGALVLILIVALVLRSSGASSAEWVSVQQLKMGALDVTVDADGSVASNQSVDLMPKTSGLVTDIAVKEGESVSAGQLLLSLDAYDASLSVKNAELDLESAQVKLDQINGAADASDVKTAENALSQAEQSEADVTTQYNEDKTDDTVALQNAQDDLEQERVDAYSLSAEAFAQLPTTLSTVDDILNGHAYSSNQANISFYHDQSGNRADLKTQADDLKDADLEADSTYHDALNIYNATDVNSSSEQIVSLLNETYAAAEQFSVLLKNMDVFLLSLQDIYNSDQTEPAALQSHIDTIEAAIAVLNPELASLSNEVQTLQNLDQDVSDAERALTNLDTNYISDLKQAQLTVEAKQLVLDALNDGSDANDIKTQEIAVEKAQNNLASAQEKYDNFLLRAPFSGVITAVSVDLGQSVSSGTVAFTLVSSEKLVEVSLNEVDVSQVKIGQTGTATFDALPGVTVPVTLAFVSEVHDETSSVVQYTSHLKLDQDVPDLKEGMSAHLKLTLQHLDSVLLAPKTALKTQDGKTMVEVATPSAAGLAEKTLYLRSALTLATKEVTVGVTGADEVEIASGLSEGEWVVFYSASEQISAPVTTRPSGAFGEGAINNGAKTTEK